MGSMQVFDTGNVLIGWGMDPAATEFRPDGTAIWEADHLGTMSYRVAKHAWTGRPSTAPDIAVSRHRSGRLAVSMSWNGATEMAGWRVLTGATANTLTPRHKVDPVGFETTVLVDRSARVRAEALDARGNPLGRSRIVHV